MTYKYHTMKKFIYDNTAKPSWQITKVQPKYDTYVVIIGESVRRDYMNLYGYLFDNTPFLSSVNATVFNNYISSAPNTPSSLQRTLYLTNKNKIYLNNTIVNLANKAGFKTYWLSNQGFLGNYDTPVSKVASQADQKYFLERKTFTSTTFDTQLLPIFKQVINNKDKKRLIFVHLMGSHSNFCKRIKEQPNFKVISKDMSCYIKSIKDTDTLIENIYNITKANDKSFSILYFADHGLSSRGNTLRHNSKYKQNYEVPLIQISSDDKTRNYINAKKSGFDLIYGMAEWLGISEETLSKNLYVHHYGESFSSQSLKNDLVDYESLPNDPIMLPNEYK